MLRDEGLRFDPVLASQCHALLLELFHRRLAAYSLGRPVNEQTVNEAIDRAFVRGFRLTMVIAAFLAVAGSLSAVVLIDGKKRRPVKGRRE